MAARLGSQRLRLTYCTWLRSCVVTLRPDCQDTLLGPAQAEQLRTGPASCVPLLSAIPAIPMSRALRTASQAVSAFCQLRSNGSSPSDADKNARPVLKLGCANVGPDDSFVRQCAPQRSWILQLSQQSLPIVATAEKPRLPVCPAAPGVHFCSSRQSARWFTFHVA